VKEEAGSTTRPSGTARFAHPSSGHAAVAIGATSVHFTACSVDGRVLTPLADESVLLGLGSVVDREGAVSPDTQRDLVSILVTYASRARDLGCSTFTVVATEPLRRASNEANVRAEIESAIGAHVCVLSHEEEGLLSLLGATGGVPPGVDHLLVDVGGGSSEYVFSGPGRRPATGALPVGAARLTAAVVAHDPPTAAEVADLRTLARRSLAEADQLLPTAATFVGGTASNLVKIIPAARVDRTLTTRRLATAFATLRREPSEQVAGRFGIHAARVRILPGGAALVEAFLRRYSLRAGLTSEASLREGVVLAVALAGPAWRSRLVDLAAGAQADDRTSPR
jgi:exopolyphosphatase / guanosine-5'-triphosphate,3'-diphosphate pyrophosphatase